MSNEYNWDFGIYTTLMFTKPMAHSKNDIVSSLWFYKSIKPYTPLVTHIHN
jgi:hypothetical protein